jgi:hypothetical protein
MPMHLQICVGTIQWLHQTGLDQAESNGVCVYVVSAPFLGQGPGKADDAGFG